MMETVLNVGMNELVLERLISTSGGDECFALDVYRRFLIMFGTIVLKASDFYTLLWLGMFCDVCFVRLTRAYIILSRQR
jgi:hypothetical protein